MSGVIVVPLLCIASTCRMAFLRHLESASLGLIALVTLEVETPEGALSWLDKLQCLSSHG